MTLHPEFNFSSSVTYDSRVAAVAEETQAALHPPGQPTLTGVLDVGLKCLHSCQFCYYSAPGAGPKRFTDLRNATFRSFEECADILRLLRSGSFRRVDITGGEPCLHPRIVDLVRLAEEDLNLRTRVITLGQLLTQTMHGTTLLDQLLEAGLTDLLLSVHAVRDDLFSRLTGGHFRRLNTVMDRLAAMNYEFSANTVVCAENVAHLPEIAAHVAARGVHTHNFILFNAYYKWGIAEVAARMLPAYVKIAPFLQEATEILERAGAAVNIRYAPLCAFTDLRRNMVGAAGVLFDPSEWGNRAGNFDRPPEFCAARVEVDEHGTRPCYALNPPAPERATELAAVRGLGFKEFPAACARCALINACDGFDPRGLQRLGPSAARPISGPRLQNAVVPERLTYLRAFTVKTTPLARKRAFHRTVENLTTQGPLS